MFPSAVSYERLRDGRRCIRCTAATGLTLVSDSERAPVESIRRKVNNSRGTTKSTETVGLANQSARVSVEKTKRRLANPKYVNELGNYRTATAVGKGPGRLSRHCA